MCRISPFLITTPHYLSTERIRSLLGQLSLCLEDLVDNLLLLDEERPHDLLPHGPVRKNSSVRPEDLLVPEAEPGPVGGSGRLDSPHGALGHRGALLEVLEHQLAM